MVVELGPNAPIKLELYNLDDGSNKNVSKWLNRPTFE